MADGLRIDDLRRRVQTDPTSIAFAQLAEECRRAGAYQEAVEVCRAGLAIHPGYTSARVTLGRALLQLNQLDDAKAELQRVLAVAPNDFSALRALAQIHERQGLLPEALAQYQAAHALAPNDPELEQTVARLSPTAAPASVHSDKAARTIVALEQWLDVIHAARADDRA
jgi:tetratricopeptide (TPR) repeat protein